MSQRITHPSPALSRTPAAVKLVAAFVVMVLLLAGIFLLGRLANDDRTAMALTTAWFGVVLVGAFLVTRSRRDLRAPLAGGYAIVAIAAAILLGLPMLTDKEVSERVVTGAPADASGTTGNVEVLSGKFTGISHPGSGTAAIVELADGGRKLTLTDFETDNGPDLRVYLATGDPGQGELGEFVDLGALKGNVGDQQYEVGQEVDLDRFSNVVIWCRAFSVGFTSAPLA